MKDKIINLIKNYKVGAIIILLLLVTAIPITLLQLKKNQDSRSRASGGAIAVILSPLTKNVTIGDIFDIHITMDSAGYSVSAVDITGNYDPNLLEPIRDGSTFPPDFVTIKSDLNVNTGIGQYVGVNPTANVITGSSINLGTIRFRAKAVGTATVGFSNIHINGAGVEGALPVNTDTTKNGTYTIEKQASLTPIPTSSVCGTIATNPKGADLAAALATRTGLSASFWLGQLTPQLASGVFSPDEIMNALNSDYTSITYSADPNRPHSLWLGRIPGAMQGQPGCPGVPPVSLSTTPTPTGTAPTSTPRPIASPTAAITPITTPAAGANITLNLRLPGIGSGSGSNNSPKRPTRTASVALFDATGKLVKTVTAAVSYDGAYYGLVPLGTLTPGSYEAKVKLDNTLWKRIPGILTISAGNQIIQTSQLDLISGDISGTVNLIDLSDYSAVLSCYAGTCAADIKTLADFNDDGTVDARDLNILLRSFSNLQGD